LNRAHALRLIVAAGDDAVLAAWAAVVCEHRMPATSDISPYDALDNYQEFFSLGLITTANYDEAIRLRSFSAGVHPAAERIQDVLHNVLFLCPEHKPEEPMSKNNPFSHIDAPALTTRENNSPGLATSRSPAPSLSGRGGGVPLAGSNSGAPPLVPFTPSREVLPPTPSPGLGMQAPQGRNLPCTDPGAGEDGLRPRMFCGECDTQLTLKQDGSQGLGPDDMPGGNVSVMEVIWYAECGCGLIYHCSAGRRDIPHEAFR